MKKPLSLLLIPVLAGCLTTESPELAEWSISIEANPAMKNTSAEFGVARLSQLVVRAPYDTRSIQVLRANGTLASDPYNHFAALPSQLLKGPVQDILAESPLFTAVVGSSSSTTVSYTIELTVTKLQLNCSGGPDALCAEAEVAILVLDRERRIVLSGAGSGSVNAEDGAFGRAFSGAVRAAIEGALIRK